MHVELDPTFPKFPPLPLAPPSNLSPTFKTPIMASLLRLNTAIPLLTVGGLYYNFSCVPSRSLSSDAPKAERG